MENKTLIIITTYNRRLSLSFLVAALEKQACDIVIFDDRSDWDVTALRSDTVRVVVNPEHRGKAGFWKTYNDIFEYCREHQYEYYIILPDDVEPCPDFVRRAIAAYGSVGCVSLSPFLTNLSVASGYSRWGRKPVIAHDTYYESGYFDCSGVVRRDFFEALDWHMEPIIPCVNPYKSSGVGRQITLRLQSKGRKMCHVKRTLLACTHRSSVMNPEERAVHPVYADWNDNERCVDVHIASLWRAGHVLKTAESLMRQPETATLFVTLNNYTAEQYGDVSEGLKSLGKTYGVKVVLRKGCNRKGSNEKLSQLAKSKSKYIAFADDDIVYPADYLQRLIHGCNIRNAAVSFHGSQFRRFPIKKYYNGDRCMLSWNITLTEDVRADIIGTGVGLLRREWFTADELKALYADAPEVSMDDIIVSCVLSGKHIERWVLAHRSGCIRIKEYNAADDYVYDRYKDDDAVQVQYINANYVK